MLKIVRMIGLGIGALLFAGGVGLQPARAQSPPAPTVSPAIDGVLAAFKTHPLVGIGDYHGMAQEEDFYAALVRDPRFARDVGNVVVEFGYAGDQPIIDRYVAGEDVPYAELRKVWTDTIGAFPPPFNVGIANFYAQLRATNLSLPPQQRIHVWLGDPPLVDWTKIKTRAEFVPVPGLRDRYPADIIEHEILAKGKKALVIYGTFHFYGSGRLPDLIEKDYPGAFFLVTVYAGFLEKSCSAAFEQSIQNWPTPALAEPVRGSLLESALIRPGCSLMAEGPFPPTWTEEQKAAAVKSDEEVTSGVAGDALLSLGPAARLTWSPELPDIYLDAEYRKEVVRHMQIVAPPNADSSLPNLTAEKNPAAPHYIRP